MQTQTATTTTARAPRGSSNPMLDVQLVELEIARLLEEYPELAEDEDLRADMVEGSTSAHDVLDTILMRIRDAECDANAVASRIEYLDARQDAARRRGAAMRRLATAHHGGRRPQVCETLRRHAVSREGPRVR